MHGPTSQRAILVTLRDGLRLSAKRIAEEASLDPRNAANLCSSMTAAGLLVEHPNDQGGRKGRKYAANVAVHPADKRILDGLVLAYGSKLIRKLAREAAS